MDTAPRTVGPAPRPDPDQDRSGAPVPARIAEILSLVQTLTTHGRRIADLITRPTTWFGFVIIARLFGTVAIPDMAAQIQRGIMRAMALEAMLLRRTQRGADLIIPAPTKTGPRKPRTTTKPPEPKPQAAPLTLDTLPTRQEVEAWVRRRPIGRTIAAIVLDLGLAPAICEGALWTRLHEAIETHRGSLTTVMKEVRRRVARFQAEDQSIPWPALRPREDRPPVLGFFIGQEPTAATAAPS